MRKVLGILCVLTFPALCYAQVWVVRYNGRANANDDAYGLAVDEDGNVYVAGRSPGLGTGFDFATVKYNADGVQLWETRYDGPGNDIDELRGLVLDNACNVYVTGGSQDEDSYQDYATVKYNSAGVEQWVRRYSGEQIGPDYAWAIAVDIDCNVYVTGGSYKEGTDIDYATVKYTSAGEEQWVARYNGPGNDFDFAWDITVDDAGNVYVTGYSYDSLTCYDYATIKYDAEGKEQWVARYNGPADSIDHAYAVAVDEADNVYVTGWSFDVNSDYDYATVKYNSAGVEQWVKRYNGPVNSDDRGWDITVDAEGNICVTGDSYGMTSASDFATMKYNPDGTLLWVMRYDGTGNESDQRPAIATDDACDVYISGGSMNSSISYDYATVKYTSTGEEQWVERYNGPGNSTDKSHAITIDNAGHVYVTGGSFGWETGYDFATIKYATVGIEEQNTVVMKNECIISTICSGPLLLPEGRKCKIFDITGRIMTSDNLKPGIYFLEIDGKIVQKIVKIK